MKDKKILVVDDDQGILEAVSLILEFEGYTVQTTFKGEETYQKVEEFEPHLIILDVLMSGKDGREICKNLKQSPKTNNIPILMFSAHPKAHEGAVKFGADSFIAKPFEMNDLLEKVKQLVK